MSSKWDEGLVATIAEALTEDGDAVTDGHRWDAERVLDAIERAGYRITLIDGPGSADG